MFCTENLVANIRYASKMICNNILFAIFVISLLGYSAHASEFNLSTIKDLLEENDYELESGLNAYLSKYGCSNCLCSGCSYLYGDYCRDQPRKLQDSLITMDLSRSNDFVLKAAQFEQDCQSAPPNVAGISKLSNTKDFTSKAYEGINAKIYTLTQEVLTCREQSGNIPLRCLQKLIPPGQRKSSGLTYSEYKRSLEKAKSSFEDLLIFPDLIELIKDELVSLENHASAIRKKCKDIRSTLTLDPEEFISQNKCNELNINSDEVLRIRNTYQIAWDDYQWSVSGHIECSKGEPNKCDGVNQYANEFPNGKHIIDVSSALDDGLWNSTGFIKCENPINKTDCDLVLEYLNRYPRGRNADLAKDIYAKANGKIEQIILQENRRVDSTSWKISDVDACKESMNSTACDGVKNYAKQYKNGIFYNDAVAAIEFNGCLKELRANEYSGIISSEEKFKKCLGSERYADEIRLLNARDSSNEEELKHEYDKYFDYNNCVEYSKDKRFIKLKATKCEKKQAFIKEKIKISKNEYLKLMQYCTDSINSFPVLSQYCDSMLAGLEDKLLVKLENESTSLKTKIAICNYSFAKGSEQCKALQDKIDECGQFESEYCDLVQQDKYVKDVLRQHRKVAERSGYINQAAIYRGEQALVYSEDRRSELRSSLKQCGIDIKNICK